MESSSNYSPKIQFFHQPNCDEKHGNHFYCLDYRMNVLGPTEQKLIHPIDCLQPQKDHPNHFPLPLTENYNVQ